MNNKPNILFVTCDHLRYDTLGCNGDSIIQTPAIDELASRAVCFDSYFVQNPVCQPSRAAFMTGRYPRHIGVRWNGSSLNENEMTMPEFFKANGYNTACIGKHHISQKRFTDAIDYISASKIRRNWAENPDGEYVVKNENEFEAYVRSIGFEYKTGYALPNFRENLGAVPSNLPEDCHIDAYVGNKCIEYLEQVDKNKPFFLWLGFYGPHHPYVPSGRFAYMYNPDVMPPFHKHENDIKKKPIEYNRYFLTEDHKFKGFIYTSEEKFRNMKAAYYGMVSQLDWQLGMIIDTLSRNNLINNTIIVFTSDHGEFLGDHGIAGKAPFLLDCMLHVPCFIKVPGSTQSIHSQDFMESVDLFPTLAALCGLHAPEFVQGRDMSYLVTGLKQETYRKRQFIYAEAVDKKCIRSRDWKLIHYPGKKYGELYKLDEDPYELDNLYHDMPEKSKELTFELYHLLDLTEDFIHPTYKQFKFIDERSGELVRHYHTW